ncbi:general stress protein [Bacillus sp. JJ722]|uniref:general stress protein n=1 Tax=Bacillus sp. JJ722 TaxID=3122973 RepID=UPI002FFE7BC6
MYQVHVVENGVQAKEKIDVLTATGYTKNDIYIFAHDKDRSEHLTEITNTKEVGVKEQGLLDSMGNVFRSRGDELRSKMTNLGLSSSEASKYEEEMDLGKVLVVAVKH